MARSESKEALVMFLLVLILTLFLPAPLVLAHHAEQFALEEKHLLLVIIPQFSFIDLPDFLKHLDPAIQEQLQFAAISMRTAGGFNLTHNLLTLSTGERAIGLNNWNAYHQEEEVQGEPAKARYTSWSGKTSTAPILHPAIFQLHQHWQKNGLVPARLGWLGQRLRETGIYTAGFGNSDTREKKQRLAPTFVMNQAGEAQGLVNEQILSTDAYFPTGKKTDWSTLSTELASIWQSKEQSFLVVELGDLERLHAESAHMDEQYAVQVKEDWFREWANWYSQLIGFSEEKHIPLAIWTLSPMVSSQAKQEGKLLAPMFTWSANQEQGLLSSASTRQAGLITNVDLLPSICAYFGLEKPGQVMGQSIETSREFALEGEEISSWLHTLDYVFLIYSSRRQIISTYISIVICLLLITVGFWWLERTRKPARQAIRITIGGILLSPVYFLWLTPLIKWLTEWQWLLLLLFVSILTSWLLLKLSGHDALYLAVIGTLNTVFILIDLVQGSPQMMRSFLGYDPIVGARFYGLGNEYAGLLLGSSMLSMIAGYSWLPRQGRLRFDQGWKLQQVYLGIAGLFCAIILYLMAAPNYGTNLGATLASFPTYLFLLFTLFTFQWNWKWILASLGILGISITIFLALHMQGEHTHIGAAMGLILAGDLDAFWAIVQRKWEMNMRLIRVSLWGKLFVISLLVLTVCLFRLKRKQGQISLDSWFQGLRITALGSVIILLVNDSGIVAAATTMIYVAFPFMYLRVSEQKTGEKLTVPML